MSLYALVVCLVVLVGVLVLVNEDARALLLVGCILACFGLVGLMTLGGLVAWIALVSH
jgi:hypothetical protein